MSESRRKIFISYRREDCAIHAGRLAENLRAVADDEVFLDIDTIVLGENFVKRIEREIGRCDVVLVVIGDDWMTLASRDGRLRIADPLDFVHVEVKAALERDVPVVPVLVENASMPRPEQLPDELRELAYRNGAELRDASWTGDVARLAAALPAPASRASGSRAGRGGSAAERKERSRLDFIAAEAFVDSIPVGRWSSYKEVARAAGAPAGAMAIGSWLLRGARTPNAWRVLTSRGEVSEGWTPATAEQPQTTAEVRDRLRAEGIDLDAGGRAEPSRRWTALDAREAGVPLGIDPQRAVSPPSTDTVVVAARKAYPDYLGSNSYVCQAGRTFRAGTRYVAFYAEREIKPEVPLIVHRRDNVMFDLDQVSRLRLRDEPFDSAIADLVELSLDPSAYMRIRRERGHRYQVFLLSSPTDPETLRLEQVVHHQGPAAWTQSQRYTRSSILATSPTSTDEL